MDSLFVIKNGRIIDPANSKDEIGDVLVSGKTIKAVGRGLDAPGAKTLDAKGLWVAPGLIDLHAHFREPGQEYKETIETGARAAVAGGFTTVCVMPNTSPVVDSAEAVAMTIKKGKSLKLAKVLPIGAVTAGQKGLSLSSLREMAAAGACAFSEDGKSVADSSLMKKALQVCAELNLPMMSHCEDALLAGRGVINQGEAALRLSLEGISNDSEEAIVARDLVLAASTGCHVHICHISTKTSAALLREAKARGVRASGEATPHHLFLCDEDILENDGKWKMNPPLRARQDMLALRQALACGDIDAVATDHAPHSKEEKSRGFQSAFGIIGLETALALCLSELEMSPMDLIDRLSAKPAKILGIKAGALTPGYPADITVIDPEALWTVDPSKFQTLGRSTPFEGRTLKGVAKFTIIDGRVVRSHGD
ncbi:MAG: dihydroorotase [Clostridiales bacterium]|nr:dihydroorotase [Clostridiales bacterium]